MTDRDSAGLKPLSEDEFESLKDIFAGHPEWQNHTSIVIPARWVKGALATIAAKDAEIANLQADVALLDANLSDQTCEVALLHEQEQRSNEVDDENDELRAERDALKAEVERLTETLETIAEGRDAGRHDGKPEHYPAHDADTMFALACAALTPKEN